MIRKTVITDQAPSFFSCLTQLSMKFIMHVNVKMPTIVDISTFIGMIKTASENLKARTASRGNFMLS